jgi:hypothetical protein
MPGPQTGRVLSAIPWTNSWSVLFYVVAPDGTVTSTKSASGVIV